MKSIAQQAAEALAALGETPDEIAANLEGAGFKGEQLSSETCPCGECLAIHIGFDDGRYPRLVQKDPYAR